MNKIPVTVIGNLTGDPELRFTPSGAAVANGTVAHTPRVFDKQTNEWKEGETTFLRFSVWRDQAENVAESLKRGDRVIVTGNLVTRSWQTDDGSKRSVQEIEADEIGPSLLWAQARPQKAERGGATRTSSPAADDPWASR